MVFHSNRMEGLLELLLNYVKERPLSPLQSETILVQSNGMKHWLTLSLAHTSALGICAATRLELPSSQLWQIYRSVLGADKLPAHMALDKAPLVWRILRRLPEWLKDPCFSPLAHYLGDDTQGSRAFGLAQQLADVLDGYQNYRADWLEHWAAGRDVLDRAQALPPAHAWQAAMWRDLLGDVQAHLPAAPTGFQARSDVHKAFMQALKALSPQQLLAVLPPRLLVFAQPEARRQLEGILHPAIRQAFAAASATAGGLYQIHAIPLLAESGRAGEYDRVLVVDCPRATQLQRLLARDQETLERAEAILAAQATREARLAVATDVLMNTGTLDDLTAKVAELHAQYLEAATNRP